MSKKVKRRKLLGEILQPHSAISRELRNASQLLGEGRREAALQLLAQTAVAAENDIDRSKIANLVGKSQYELGRYDDAAERFKEAARLGSADELDPKRFLAPSLGRIRCLLKGQRQDEALAAAEELSRLVIEKSEAYRELLESAGSSNSTLLSLNVPARPVRPSVALTRIGVTFLEEGYIENGTSFLERVIHLVPNGASRARQFLARSLVSLGDYESAEQLAAQSLRMGEFRAKTVPSWEILIRARKAQEKQLLDQALYQEFNDATVGGRVKSRAEMLIIGELRRHGDNEWLELADKWKSVSANVDPIVRTEILKLLLSEVKAGTLDADNRDASALKLAGEIYAEPTLSASEGVSLAKVLGEFGPNGGLSDSQIDRWLGKISVRFGPEYGFRAVHACALGMSAKRNFESARILFRRLMNEAQKGSDTWGKAVWSLAKMESEDDNPEIAARLYLRYAGNEAFEATLRLQAFLSWLTESEKTGTEIDIASVNRNVSSLLSGINDYRPLLDAGRQLALAGPRFREVLAQVVDQAEAKSLIAFNSATTTREALVVLLALSRRSFYDFGRGRRLVEIHEGLSEEKLDWLWSHDARFWEYLSIVMRSYFRSNQMEQGESLGSMITTNREIPPVGFVFLGVHYSEWLARSGQISKAEKLFKQVVDQGPSHRLASRAYFWLALRAYKRGNIAETESHLIRARKCLHPRPVLLSEWETDAKSGLFLRIILGNPSLVDLSTYGDDFLQKQNQRLLRDLGSVEV